MRVVLLVGITTLLAVSWLATSPGSARAEGELWAITRYQAVATVEAVGGDTVIVLDFDFDFGDQPAHGPLLVLPTRARDSNVAGRRSLDLDTTVESATSSTGASADVQVTRGRGEVRVRIGDPDAFVTGVQSYQVRYRVHGFVDPRHPTTGLDEFTWFVLGVGFEVPVSGISVTLNAPAAATETLCYHETGHSMNCKKPVPAASMTWTLDRVDPGDNLRVGASFPAGTFTDTEKRGAWKSWMAITPATVAVSGGLVLALGLCVVLVGRRGGEVRAVYSGSGLVPEGARPGEIGALLRQTVDATAITATIVDLAVRRYLVIQPQLGRDVVLTILPHSPQSLTPYESRLMATLFAGRYQVTTRDLASPAVGAGLVQVKSDLMGQLTTQPTTWFTADPSVVRRRWLLAGLGIAVAGAVLWLPLALVAGWGLPPAVLAAEGVALMIGSRWISPLTPQGRAVRHQAVALQQVLRTQPGRLAQQIPVEPGHDLFARYLPFAIVLGEADRWVSGCRQLAATGTYQPDVEWLGGATMHTWGFLTSAPDFGGITASLARG